VNRTPKIFNMTLKPEHSSGMPRSRWEHEVRKRHAEGRTQKEILKEGLLEDRDDRKGWLL
jgi:hypothetical protein